ncbi:uncharacterized protein Z520_02158 [Fonsecaea multimorphosa CBS 102226]|uniref:Alcohol dehydrogenase-like C-terminal domain-containing protein n=1 Tax=Fonsecaea multimorphosa CBS 102226 TaxID=1442371 RepID=A0A0D2KF55_9EURO|nr:uncharacterized protein Z520_02158 [Fonsecaea multimorphosa CBS 102226]KIY02020.1 hypothetical protein Z520_02158 [Fonsecaea multimorphosa CBS 102226]
MEIRKGEKSGILIINGAGGVGSVASQVARRVLELPVVVTTASRDETVQFTKTMGATHVVNHRQPLAPQITDLHLEYPIKYIFITSRTEQYFKDCGKILCAPFGKVCSIVQTEEMNKMYGTEFMAKSLSFIWELLGTKPYYGVDVNSHGNILKELASLVDTGTIKSHLQNRLPLTLEGAREGHSLVEAGSSIGKNGLGIEEGGVVGNAFS